MAGVKKLPEQWDLSDSKAWRLIADLMLFHKAIQNMREQCFLTAAAQNAFSENQNSLATLLRVNGAKIFLGGDLHDIPSTHPLADRVNYQIARKIGEEMDLYKAPHHGTRGTALLETMQIYRPKNVVVTNGLKYLPPDSEIFQSLRAANPDAEIYLTENQHVIFSVDANGTVRLDYGPEPYNLSEG